MAALEVTPLLADPPIDDDSYRYEAQSFPNAEQKHAIYVAYLTTTLISRYCEMSATLMLALTYRSSLLPIAFYSFAVLAVSAWFDRITAAMARPFTSRLGLLATTVVQQRAAMVLFFVLILVEARLPDAAPVWRAATIVGLTGSIIWLKASLALYQTTFRWEWLRILANNQQNVRMLFETGIHGMSTVSQLLFPTLATILVQTVSVEQSCYAIILVAVLGLLVELSVVYKLYSSCYALHLPRAPYISSDAETSLEHGAMIGVLTTPLTTAAQVPMTASDLMPFSSRPLSRIIKYIRRRPVPVLATLGSVLANVSLITFGPHVVWYLLRKNMYPAMLGIIKMFQTLVTLRPVVYGWPSFVFSVAGIVSSIALLAAIKYCSWGTSMWVHGFGFAIVLARSGVPGISLMCEQFVADYLADEDMDKLYREGAALLQIECELIIHVLAVIWPYESQFLWPMATSALFMLVGIFLILVVMSRFARGLGTILSR